MSGVFVYIQTAAERNGPSASGRNLRTSDRIASTSLVPTARLMDPGAVETGQRDPLSAALPAQIGQELGERVTSTDVGVPICGHHQ